MYWDGSGYACVRLAYQLETLPFLPLITMASSLDLCNPPCKAARYLAWKAAIRRRAQVTDSHTHIHTYIHTHTHTHTPDSSVAVSAGVYRSNLDFPQIMDARSIGSSISAGTLGFIWTKQQSKSLCYVQCCHVHLNSKRRSLTNWQNKYSGNVASL